MKKLHRFASTQQTITHYHNIEWQHKHGYCHKNEWQHNHGPYNSRVGDWSYGIIIFISILVSMTPSICYFVYQWNERMGTDF